MKPVVVFAMRAEFSPWRRRHAFRRANSPAAEAYETQIGRAAVRVILSGIGAPDTRRLQEALFAQPVEAVIVAGAAGGLKAQYRCGEVLVAARLKEAAGRVIPLDDRMVSLASQAGATIVDSFLTLDRMVLRAEDKAALGRDADAVDMESFIIVNEAAARGIPAVATRVVVDTVNEDLPLDLTGAIRADGTINMPRAIGSALSQPQRWPLLARAGRSYRRALGELAIFLDRFIGALA